MKTTPNRNLGMTIWLLGAALVLPLAVGLSACGHGGPATPPGLSDSGQLMACPDSPNCVSSQADDEEHKIEALPLLGEPSTAIERLAALVDAMPRTEILKKDERYLAVEFRTPLMRFSDDVELVLDEPNGLIQVRSASRTGYSDLGVNRKRVEQIRSAWAEINPAQ